MVKFGVGSPVIPRQGRYVFFFTVEWRCWIQFIMEEEAFRVFVWRYAETQNFAISEDKISQPALRHPPKKWGNL